MPNLSTKERKFTKLSNDLNIKFIKAYSLYEGL